MAETAARKSKVACAERAIAVVLHNGKCPGDSKCRCGHDNPAVPLQRHSPDVAEITSDRAKNCRDQSIAAKAQIIRAIRIDAMQTEERR